MSRRSHRIEDLLRAELAERYSGCLCLPCLRELIEADLPRQPVMGPGKASG